MMLLSALLLLSLPTLPICPQSGDKSVDQTFGRWLLSEPEKAHAATPNVCAEQTLVLSLASGTAKLSIEASNLHLCVKTRAKFEKDEVNNAACFDGFTAPGNEVEFFDKVLTFAPSAEALDEIRSTRSDFITALKVMREDAVPLYGGVHRIPFCAHCVF